MKRRFSALLGTSVIGAMVLVALLVPQSAPALFESNSRAGATTFNALPFADLGDNSMAGTEGTEFVNTPCGTVGKTVWYRYQSLPLPVADSFTVGDAYHGGPYGLASGAVAEVKSLTPTPPGTPFAPLVAVYATGISGSPNSTNFIACASGTDPVRFSTFVGSIQSGPDHLIFWLQVGSTDGQGGRFLLTVNKTPLNDMIADPYPLTELSWANGSPKVHIATSNLLASRETNESSSAGQYVSKPAFNCDPTDSIGHTLWWRFLRTRQTAPPTLPWPVTIDTSPLTSVEGNPVGTTFDTIVNVWEWLPSQPGSPDPVIGKVRDLQADPYVCDDNSGAGNAAKVTFDALFGRWYYIQIGGKGSAAGVLNFTVS